MRERTVLAWRPAKQTEAAAREYYRAVADEKAKRPLMGLRLCVSASVVASETFRKSFMVNSECVAERFLRMRALFTRKVYALRVQSGWIGQLPQG